MTAHLLCLLFSVLGAVGSLLVGAYIGGRHQVAQLLDRIDHDRDLQLELLDRLGERAGARVELLPPRPASTSSSERPTPAERPPPR